MLTRCQRTTGLQLIARELTQMGHTKLTARSIKPIHIEKLIAKWKADGLSTGTIKNRMSWIRYWTGGVRRSSIASADNSEHGIGTRAAFNGDKARTTVGAALAKLGEREQLVVRMQMAFGMRLEESILVNVNQAWQGDALHMQASWCKGGRARVIPIVHERQRALLDEVRSLVGTASLIPLGMDKHTYRRQIERKTWAAGIRNVHGHRHWYCQWRYRTMTGRQCTAAGGRPYEQLTRKERGADWMARKIISREVGHERVSITDCYLGYRFARRQAVTA